MKAHYVQKIGTAKFGVIIRLHYCNNVQSWNGSVWIKANFPLQQVTGRKISSNNLHKVKSNNRKADPNNISFRQIQLFGNRSGPTGVRASAFLLIRGFRQLHSRQLPGGHHTGRGRLGRAEFTVRRPWDIRVCCRDVLGVATWSVEYNVQRSAVCGR